VNPDQCVFEKGILTSQCCCSRSQKLLIAEREAANCTDKPALEHCQAFLDILKNQARFTLKLRDAHQNLGHAKAIKVQIGGLRGLYQALYGTAKIPRPIPEVAGLIEESLERWGSPDKLPFSRIIPEISAYEGRKRRGHRKK